MYKECSTVNKVLLILCCAELLITGTSILRLLVHLGLK